MTDQPLSEKIKEQNWVKHITTTTCKCWKDKDWFAVFYKDDFINFYNKTFKEGRLAERKNFQQSIQEFLKELKENFGNQDDLYDGIDVKQKIDTLAKQKLGNKILEAEK